MEIKRTGCTDAKRLALSAAGRLWRRENRHRWTASGVMFLMKTWREMTSRHKGLIQLTLHEKKKKSLGENFSVIWILRKLLDPRSLLKKTIWCL